MNSDANSRAGNEQVVKNEIEKLQTHVTEYPTSPLFCRLAGLYNQAGEHDKAEKLLTEGVSRYPEYSTALLVLVQTYVSKKNLEKARETLEKLLLLNPSSFKAHRVMADLNMEEERLDLALSHYRMANRFDPLNRDVIQMIKEIKDSAVEQAEEMSKKTAEQPVKTGETQKSEDLDVIEPASSPEEIEKYKALLEDSDKTEETGAEPEAVTHSEKTEGAEELEADSSVATFTDESGLMYFVDDDEVSFEQYKKRLELVKEGKAKIVSKEDFNEIVRAAGSGSAVPAVKEEEKPVEEKPSILQASFEIKKAEEDADQEIADAGETSGKLEAEKEEPEELEPQIDEDDPNALLEIVEMSYRDYLDLLDDEQDLLEALFPEDQPGQDYQETSGYEDILAEETAETAEDDDTVLTYREYVSRIADPAERQEAEFEVDASVSYGEYVASLTSESEKREAMVPATLGAPDDQPMSYQEFLTATEEEPVTYSEFMAEQLVNHPDFTLEKIETARRSETAAQTEDEDISVEEFKEAEKTAVVEETTPSEKAEPAAEEEGKKPVEPVVEEEPVAEPKAQEKTEIVEAEQATAVGKDLTQDDITSEEEPEEEAESIDPSKASTELAESYLAQGKFGKAYQVFMILKTKQADDPKIEKRLSELKKLSVWSRQLAG